jgi:hypothetical protein
MKIYMLTREDENGYIVPSDLTLAEVTEKYSCGNKYQVRELQSTPLSPEVFRLPKLEVTMTYKWYHP